jgi:osmoprotectant transport system permease protein
VTVLALVAQPDGEPEPLVRWDWVARNATDDIAEAFFQHLALSFTPIVIGLAIALPLGLACVRWRWLYPPMLSATSILYALPAIALFIVLIAFTGLTYTTVVIPLSLYTLSVLLPSVVDGLKAVPDNVRQAATAMGFRPLRRMVMVELPIAVPVVIAGLRVATVSNISLVSVGALIGIGGFGQLFTDGFSRDFPTPIVVGVVLTVALALVADLILLAVQWLLRPRVLAAVIEGVRFVFSRAPQAGPQAGGSA